MTTAAISQHVWTASFSVLDPSDPDAHDKATRIAEYFEALCRAQRSTPRVPDDVRAAIKADLIKGVYSYAQIRARNGVGTSTVQRIAQELLERGGTVHTTGKRKRGLRFRQPREGSL